MKKEIKNSLLLLLTALIWGVAFVAQRQGGDQAGPYTFNAIRFLIGAAALSLALPFLDRRREDRRPKTAADRRLLIKSGVTVGVILFVSSNLQQLGLYYGTGAGKAGFLTACYILLVPVFGIFLGRKCSWNVWVSVPVTVVGLYFLCLTEGSGLSFQKSDILILLCAVCFSAHIMTVDHFSPLVDGVRMACIQFLTCGLLGLIPMVAVDMAQAGFLPWLQTLGGAGVWVALLYTGGLSCGVAYTLQIIAQNGLNPTVASLIMSLEAVFSALAGALLLGERMSGRELLGCALTLGAALFAQVEFRRKARR